MGSAKVINDPALTALLDKLDDQRENFVQSVTTSVELYIKHKTTEQCLGLVTRDYNGNITEHFPAELSISYAGILINFCLETPYNEQNIDSILTDQIIDLVAKAYQQFFINNSKDINDALTQALMRDPVFARTIASAIIENKAIRFASTRAKSQVFDQIVAALTATSDKSLALVKSQLDVITPTLAKGVSTIMGTTFGANIVNMIVAKVSTVLVTYIQMLLMKLLSLPIVKAAIIAAVKKVVIIGVIAGFFHVVTAATGISIAGIVLIFLAPIVLYYINYEWRNFPDKLSSSISTKLSESFSTEFRHTNDSILESLIQQITENTTTTTLRKQFSEDPELIEQIEILADLVDS